VIAVRDDELLAELRALFSQIDPPAPALLEQAQMAFSWRTIDAELADLAYDSAADLEVLAGVRDGAVLGSGPRLLGFGTEAGGDDLAVEIEISLERGRPTLIGQLMPPTAATVAVQCFGADRGTAPVVPADDLGRFRVDAVPSGPVRLRIDLGDRVIETSWVTYTA
jgi:hypothetical protein